MRIWFQTTETTQCTFDPGIKSTFPIQTLSDFEIFCRFQAVSCASSFRHNDQQSSRLIAKCCWFKLFFCLAKYLSLPTYTYISCSRVIERRNFFMYRYSHLLKKLKKHCLSARIKIKMLISKYLNKISFFSNTNTQYIIMYLFFLFFPLCKRLMT